ncbi:MAG: FtsK/SpoIIIE domain-containing protein [Magnetococcus sp. DMHC-6]
MMQETIRQRLLEYNPFASTAAADPWEERLTDVPSINRASFEGVNRLLHQLGQHPKEPLAALVLGEVGNGKTHLMARLRQSCHQTTHHSPFAWISPPESGREPYRYLLREITDSLLHTVNGLTDWQRLAITLIAENRHPNATPTENKQQVDKIQNQIHSGQARPKRCWKKMQAGLTRWMSPQERAVVQMIVWMIGSPTLRRTASEWLRGDIVHPKRLPSPFSLHQDRSGFTSEQMEEEARTILISIGRIVSRCHLPLLICFDRLEELRTPAQDVAMDVILTFLVDRMDGVLPVFFARGQFWEGLRLRLNAQTVSRLESNRFEMTGCSRSEANELIYCRLATLFNPEEIANLFFDPKILLDRLTPGGQHSPRIVITLANRRLQELLKQAPPQNEPTEKFLFSAWERLTQNRLTRRKEEPRSPERLRRMAHLFLLGTAPANETDSSEVETPTTLWLIESAFHHQTLLKELRKGVLWLESHPGATALYIRDGRDAIPKMPRWPQTNHFLQDFLNKGGKVVSLGSEHLARCLALADLYDAIQSGDFETNEGPISLETFISFLRQHLSWGTQEPLPTDSKKNSPEKTPKPEHKKKREKESPEKENPDMVMDEEAEEVQACLMATLRELKLQVELAKCITGPRFIRVCVRPLLELGTTVAKLKKHSENLQVALKTTVAPLIRSYAGWVGFDIPRRQQTPLLLMDLWQAGNSSRPASPVAFPLGLSVEGHVVWVDLATPESSSVLIGGSSGSGKTIFLQSVAVSLARFSSPKELCLLLIDPKRVGFSRLQHLPHLAVPVILEAEEAQIHLDQLVTEMEARYRLFATAGVEDILAFQQKGQHLPHWVILIDEFADLMISTSTQNFGVRAQQKTLEGTIQRLCQKGRAAGVHLLLATQRPDANVITPLIKANLQLKVAFKVTTERNSRIILDESGAEHLLGGGDMLVGGSLPEQRIQGALLSADEIALAST